MNVSEYVKGLLPSFEANRVKDGLANLSKEIDQCTLPNTQGLKEVFPANWKWKDQTIAKLERALQTECKGHVKLVNPSIIEIVEFALENMQTTVPFVQMKCDKVFNRIIATNGITFDRAAVLQYAETAEFYVNYVRILLNFITAKERCALEGNREVKGIGPEDEEYLNANIVLFGIATNIMSVDARKLKSEMDSIPDSAVDSSNEEELKVVIGESKLTPLNFAALPFPISALFRIGLFRTESQVKRFDRAVQDSKVTQYRILVLKDLINEGRSDAAIEAELADAEEELKMINYDISMMEEKYDVRRT